MDNMKFYEYVFTILSEAGHVITSSPIYVNHSSGETLYIDSSKDVVTNRFERDLLSLIDNVSLLVDVRWPGVVPELDENVQIYSATVDFPSDAAVKILPIFIICYKNTGTVHTALFSSKTRRAISSRLLIKIVHISCQIGFLSHTNGIRLLNE